MYLIFERCRSSYSDTALGGLVQWGFYSYYSRRIRLFISRFPFMLLCCLPFTILCVKVMSSEKRNTERLSG